MFTLRRIIFHKVIRVQGKHVGIAPSKNEREQLDRYFTVAPYFSTTNTLPRLALLYAHIGLSLKCRKLGKFQCVESRGIN